MLQKDHRYYPEQPRQCVMFVVCLSVSVCLCVLVLQVKYTTACSERESLRERIGQTQVEMEQLREASERRVASERIEVCVRDCVCANFESGNTLLF